MKGKKEIILAIVLGAILPCLFIRTEKAPIQHNPKPLSIAVLSGESVIQMELEEYLTGVLLGEMPSNFEMEALKAQAVAARTYTLYNMKSGVKHQTVDVCTSAGCCQAYINPDSYLSSGGSIDVLLKMRQAAQETAGQALYYGDNLINATYFSSSGGRTENAQEVWGVSVPYLQSVECADIEASYTKNMAKSEFCKALGLSAKEIYIEAPTYTEGGGIEKVSINGKTFTGVQLRNSLGLRSTQISFYVGKDKVQIITKGYGHRVGMSQYGANTMAAGGDDYREILSHFYSGITIRPYVEDEN